MQKESLLVTIICFVMLSACKQQELKSNDLFYGKWQGAKWITEGGGKEGMDPRAINFEFRVKKDSSIYKAQFGMMSETGIFNLNNNCFNAMSIYGSPKKCPILRLERDTMVWLMDSVQQPGHLYLVRVKD